MAPQTREIQTGYCHVTMEKPWLETKVELGLLERLKKDYPQFMLDHGLQEYTTPEYPGFSAKIKCW